MHVLTRDGISTISVPEQLPEILRQFTKEVIRQQPQGDLLQFAANYFAALAGIQLPLRAPQHGAAAVCGGATACETGGSSATSSTLSAEATDGQPHAAAQSRHLKDHAQAAAIGDGITLLSATVTGSINGHGNAASALPPDMRFARRTSETTATAGRGGHAAAVIDSGDAAADVKASTGGHEADKQAEQGQAPAEDAAAAEHRSREAALATLAKRLFAEADADHSGSLDRKEFRTVIRSVELGLSTAEVRAMMAEADENDDGFVDWREFLPAFLPLLRTLQANREVEAEAEEAARAKAEAALRAEMPQEQLEALMRDIFHSADTDGSGSLSRAEFKACLLSDTAAALNLTRQDVNTLLTEVDTDGDGYVDYEEFIPVAFEMLVQRLKDSFLAADAVESAAAVAAA